MTNRLNTFWHENFFPLMSLWKSDWKFPSMEMSLIAEYFLEILDCKSSNTVGAWPNT